MRLHQFYPHHTLSKHGEMALAGTGNGLTGGLSRGGALLVTERIICHLAIHHTTCFFNRAKMGFQLTLYHLQQQVFPLTRHMVQIQKTHFGMPAVIKRGE